MALGFASYCAREVASPKTMCDAAFRNITIELLRPQGEMKKFYRTINDALSAGRPDEKGIRQVSLLETDEMRGVAAGIAASSSWSPAHDGRDRLVIMIDKIHDSSGAKEKNSPFPAGKWPGCDARE